MEGQLKEGAKDDLQLLNNNHKYFGLYDQNPKVAIPLKHILVNAKIHDYIAEVTYSQLYFNHFESKLETEYYFPISSSACFHKFEAKFGSTTIQGIVKEKSQAKQDYENHREQGDTVAYAEISEENYSVMCVKIGNIPPLTEIEIIFSYVERLEISLNKLWRFTLNSYLITNPPDKNQNGNGNIGLADYPSHKDSASNDSVELFGWDIKILIQSRYEIKLLKSPSHEIDVKKSELSNIYSAQISLPATKKYTPTKDFVLLYATTSVNTPSYLLSPFEDGYCALINFFPTTNYLSFDDAYMASIGENDVFEDMVSKARGEFIFLIDRSPQNESIVPLMRKILTYFLKSLSEESYFNVIGYGEASESPISDSIKVSNQAIESVVSQTKTFISTAGGESRILKLIENIGRLKDRPQCPRMIFILTPGTIDTPVGQIIQTAKDKLFQTRLFTIGIGNGSSTDFVKRASLECYGKYEIIRAHAEVKEKIDHLLKTAVMPYFTDFEFKIDNEGLFSYIVPLPKTIGCITPNELVEFFVIFHKKLENLQKTTFRLQFYNNHNGQYEDFREEINIANSDLSEAVVKLGLKKFCDSLDKKKEVYQSMVSDIAEASKAGVIENLVHLSVKHGVLTSHTAFICVLKEGDDITRQIPTEKITASAVEAIKIKEKKTTKSEIVLVVNDAETAKLAGSLEEVPLEEDVLPDQVLKPILRRESGVKQQVQRIGHEDEELLLHDDRAAVHEDEVFGGPQKLAVTGNKKEVTHENAIKQVTAQALTKNSLLSSLDKGALKMKRGEVLSKTHSTGVPFSSIPTSTTVASTRKTGTAAVSSAGTKHTSKPTKEEAKDLGQLPALTKQSFVLGEIPLRATVLGKSRSFYDQTPGNQKASGSRRTKFEQMKGMVSNKGYNERTTVPRDLSLLGVDQNTEGYWSANENIAGILGFMLQTLLEKMPKDLQNNLQKEIIWITILVIAWCDHHYGQNMNWESIREKAVEWIQQEDVQYKEHIATADKVLNI